MSTETKTEAFKRVARRRVNKVLTAIRVLGNCSNKASYEFTEVEVDMMFSAIEELLKSTRLRFKQTPVADFDWKQPN